jgi:hypothetical protein
MPSKENPKQLKQDRLVEQLVPDPANHEPTIQLTGWLGKDAKEGFWRLYLTPQLDEYVQFAETDVIHSQPAQADQSPLGGTLVWLKSGTALQHTRVVKQNVQADFLAGGIVSNYMSGAASAYPSINVKPKGVVPNTRTYVCSINPHIPVCQPHTYVCPIASVDTNCYSGAFCDTGNFVCGYSVGCTVGRECSVNC